MIVQWIRDLNEWACPDRTWEARVAEASGRPLRWCLAIGPVVVPTPFRAANRRMAEEAQS